MYVTTENFLKDAGLDEPLLPGQIKYKQHIGKNPSTSYTMVYDWKSNLQKIRVEVRPGLTGQMPDKKDLSKFALWLQSENYLELNLSAPNTQH